MVHNHLTRREWAAALAASATARSSAAAAQSAGGEELAAARERVQRDAEKLREFPLPMATEPAAIFKP